MQKKIRQAQQEKVFYMLVLGDKEIEGAEVNVRDRSGKNSNMKTVEFIKQVKDEISTKK